MTPERTLPADGVNPYANHPGFVAVDCPLRHTVTQKDSWGNIVRCGFGCLMTGGHCLPDKHCDSRRDREQKQQELERRLGL